MYVHQNACILCNGRHPAVYPRRPLASVRVGTGDRVLVSTHELVDLDMVAYTRVHRA